MIPDVVLLGATIAWLTELVALGYIVGRAHQRRITRRRPHEQPARTGRFTPVAEDFIADAIDRVTSIPGRAVTFRFSDDRGVVLMDQAEFNRLTIRADATVVDVDRGAS